MKKIALIFAGGSGTRMHSKDKPKQFLFVNGKPIIVHTVEQFENHNEIDGIVVVCLKEWISYMKDLKYRFRLDKIIDIVEGGKTGQLSIFNGLCAIKNKIPKEEVIVLIHDGVRPIIDYKTISNNIKSVINFGSAITCKVAKETTVMSFDDKMITDIPNRDYTKMAVAPQSFWLDDILSVSKKAIDDGNFNMIDSCSLMYHYGKKLSIVIGPNDNIKITTPEDFYVFRALFDAKENQQLE